MHWRIGALGHWGIGATSSIISVKSLGESIHTPSMALSRLAYRRRTSSYGMRTG